ncbi:MAG: CehA/McbA family metallohydrolase [Clostridiales bacterium]|nr:CehA/McbA family metallohydrolase [Clostridiales bacterium]
MELKLDLHVHSERSFDGVMTLDEIVSLARAKGLDGAAVCDHGIALADAPEYPDFLLIPGVELATQFGHVLGLFVTGPVETADFYEAAERIHAQGGLTVLAHPFEHNRDDTRLLPAVPCLDGVEVWNSRADRNIREANALAARFAAAHGLLSFGGSDAHVPREIGNAAVTVQAEARTLEAVKAALLAGNAAIEGRRGRARQVAQSQLTRRRKTGAGPLDYVQWAAFAAKCLLQDMFRRD